MPHTWDVSGDGVGTHLEESDHRPPLTVHLACGEREKRTSNVKSVNEGQ